MIGGLGKDYNIILGSEIGNNYLNNVQIIAKNEIYPKDNTDLYRLDGYGILITR